MEVPTSTRGKFMGSSLPVLGFRKCFETCKRRKEGKTEKEGREGITKVTFVNFIELRGSSNPKIVPVLPRCDVISSDPKIAPTEKLIPPCLHVIWWIVTVDMLLLLLQTSDALVEADGNFTLRVTSSCVDYRDDDALLVNAVMKPRSAYVILVTDSHAQLAATHVRPWCC